jgi:hypothetical protein
MALRNDQNDAKSIFSQLKPHGAQELHRRALLPRWIRFFSWLFLILPVGIPITFAIATLRGAPFTFGLFGLTYTGSILGPQPLAMMGLIMASSAAAYGLLWGRDWGVTAGLAIGVVGLIAALGSIFAYSGSRFPFELLFQIPFILKLWDIRGDWASKPQSLAV